jgi:tRNA uracil 4-sulfurtransferase
MYERILVRFGDLTLKGKNKHLFVKKAVELVKAKVVGLNVAIDARHDRLYIELNDTPKEEVYKRLKRVSGLYSFSPMTKCPIDLDVIAQTAVTMIKETTQGHPMTFKVETKRADKNYPLTSQEVSPIIAGKILRNLSFLTVDVHHPEMVFTVEIRDDGAYLFNEQILGMGGYPVGIGGKAVVMLSGGIDSPVAGYLTMKQGIEIDCIHFESTPMTSIESVQKAIDLVEVMAHYAPENKIRLHLVPFEPIHGEIINKVPESYLVAIMRRMMYRIAEKIMIKNKALAIINGESIGQVASQTLESMQCVNVVTHALVIRPLATYDKHDIMKIAREIETMDISIRPFEDCCTVYLPQNPTIRPSIRYAEVYESYFDYAKMVDEAVANTKILVLDAYRHTNLLGKGLTVEDSIE